MPSFSFLPASSLRPTVVRRFLTASAIVALILALLIALLYYQDVRHQQAIVEREALNVVSLEREFMTQEFRSIQSDLLYLAQQEALLQFLSGDTEARNELEREYATFATQKGIYDQIRFIDLAGHEIIRVNYRQRGIAEIVPQAELQTKAMRYYFQQALLLERGEIFVSPFDLNVEHGELQHPIKPVVRFLTPAFSQSGEKRGFVVLNYLGAHLIEKLKEISAGFRGHTMLVNQSGEYLQAPNVDHEWGWMLNHNHSFRAHFPKAWKRIRYETKGLFRIDHDLFTFQRVAPARIATNHQLPFSLAQQNASSLLLVSHAPASIVAAHSGKLLLQLLMMYVGALALVSVLALYWARSGAIRQHQEIQLAESESRLRRLSSRLLTAQETERRNLSRTLHDELGQLITAIRLDLRSAAKENVDGPASRLLERAISETDQLLQSLHVIASEVRPSVLDDLGLPEAMESYVSEYAQRTGIHVRFTLQFDEHGVPPTVGENVYRIFQEALANVATHAQTNDVAVEVEIKDHALFMQIQDHGVGFRPEWATESSRLGILGMRERVELLHGQFTLTSQPGQGTSVQVMIPLQPQDAVSPPAHESQ